MAPGTAAGVGDTAVTLGSQLSGNFEQVKQLDGSHTDNSQERWADGHARNDGPEIPSRPPLVWTPRGCPAFRLWEESVMGWKDSMRLGEEGWAWL